MTRDSSNSSAWTQSEEHGTTSWHCIPRRYRESTYAHRHKRPRIITRGKKTLTGFPHVRVTVTTNCERLGKSTRLHPFRFLCATSLTDASVSPSCPGLHFLHWNYLTHNENERLLSRMGAIENNRIPFFGV